MTRISDIFELQKWMYTHKNSDGMVTKGFRDKLEIFMYQAVNIPTMLESGKIIYPRWSKHI